MPYRVGVIECDTADEARALVGRPAAAAKQPGKRRRSASANKAVAKSWADAKKLAKKEGIPVMEARKKLAKGKG